MNTRIQVEHTISEMTSGIDLVREQIRVAAGEPLGYGQSDVAFRGHAIEVRVNAEDPAQDFRPAPGTLTAYREPAGFGVRVDSAASPGFVVKPDYDSMIAKLIVWAPTRAEAFARMRRAIDDYHIAGVPTTLPFVRALLDDGRVAAGAYGTATLEAFAATYVAPPERGDGRGYGRRTRGGPRRRARRGQRPALHGARARPAARAGRAAAPGAAATGPRRLAQRKRGRARQRQRRAGADARRGRRGRRRTGRDRARG